jgi:hypothetical protein
VTGEAGNFKIAFESALRQFANDGLLSPELDVEALVEHTASPSISSDEDTVLAQRIREMNGIFVETEISRWTDEPIDPLKGWWIVVNRLAMAIVTLCENDMANESLPLVRSAFEYAMAICYATKIDETDIHENVSRRTFDDFTRAIHDSGQDSPFETLITELRKDFEESEQTEWLSKFDKRLKALNIWNDAYPFYTILSAFVHPGLAGVLSFADFDNGAKVLRNPNLWSLSMIGNPLLWALQSQCWSALAMDQVFLDGLSWKSSVLEAISGFTFPLADTLFGNS